MKLAELNAVYATCEQRCTQYCDPQVRASYITLRVWFELHHIPVVLQQGQYVIESLPEPPPQDAQGSSAPQAHMGNTCGKEEA